MNRRIRVINLLLFTILLCAELAVGQNSSLKIIEIPQPVFPDGVERTHAQGTIIVRIQFLGTGEIGTVAVVKGLTPKLNDLAVEAAKQIKFTPQQIDGKPADTFKQLEYRYIYGSWPRRSLPIFPKPKAKEGTTKTITPCPFKIAAPAANFRMYFDYSLEVTTDGSVSKVTELSNSQKRSNFKFVHDELFVECMKKWRLEPAGRYSVSFYVGTTSIGTTSEPRDYMLIVGPDQNNLKVELLLSESDTLRIEKPKRRVKSGTKH